MFIYIHIISYDRLNQDLLDFFLIFGALQVIQNRLYVTVVQYNVTPQSQTAVQYNVTLFTFLEM
jgi:hypothetical protein